MGKIRNPSFLLFLAGIVLCLLFPSTILATDGEPTGRQPAWEEPDVDRPGMDFKILWLRGGLEACQEACAQNPLCKSYSYVREGVGGRIEGCWLKSGVPPPVEDGCCVSGVKTEETISRIVRVPAFPAGGQAMPSGVPPEAPVSPPPLPEKFDLPGEKIPVTGSGNRIVAGLDFVAVPPGIANAASNGLSVAISPKTTKSVTGGAGRRVIAGMDFAAVPPRMIPAATTRRISESVPVPIPGTGRRLVRGVNYQALPLSMTKPAAGPRRIRSATRKVNGVDIKAVPPKR
jgi:hypothetical protein